MKIATHARYRFRREQCHFAGPARTIQSSGSDGIHIQPWSLRLPIGPGMPGAPLQRDADGLSSGQVTVPNRARKWPPALAQSGAASATAATAATIAAAATRQQTTAKPRADLRGLRWHQLRQTLRDTCLQRLQWLLQEKRQTEADLQVSPRRLNRESKPSRQGFLNSTFSILNKMYL